jgi:hypothetical protein
MGEMASGKSPASSSLVFTALPTSTSVIRTLAAVSAHVPPPPLPTEPEPELESELEPVDPPEPLLLPALSSPLAPVAFWLLHAAPKRAHVIPSAATSFGRFSRCIVISFGCAHGNACVQHGRALFEEMSEAE